MSSHNSNYEDIWELRTIKNELSIGLFLETKKENILYFGSIWL